VADVAGKISKDEKTTRSTSTGAALVDVNSPAQLSASKNTTPHTNQPVEGQAPTDETSPIDREETETGVARTNRAGHASITSLDEPRADAAQAGRLTARTFGQHLYADAKPASERAAGTAGTALTSPENAARGSAIPGRVDAKLSTELDPRQGADRDGRLVQAVPVDVQSSVFAPAMGAALSSVGARALRGDATEGSMALDSTASALAASSSLVNGTRSTPEPAVLQGAIDAPVGSRGFVEGMAEQVRILSNGPFDEAQIRLNPVELGPVRIELTVRDGVTNLVVTADNERTRQAIEQSTPALRSLLSESGLGLGNVDISSGQGHRGGSSNANSSFQEPRSGASSQASGQNGIQSPDRSIGVMDPRTNGAPRSRGLIDLIA
jgi:flagellar hook-length control protein FliK